MSPKSLSLLLITVVVAAAASSCKSTPKRPSGMVGNPGYKGGAEATMVEVSGLAQLTKAGSQSAYDRALEHAMRKAVEVVLGTVVRSEVLVESGTLIEDSIYSKSSGFVQKYEVLGSEQGPSTLTLNVRAWVSLKSIRDDALALGLLQSRINRPYLMVVVEDKSTDANRKGDYNAYLSGLFQDYFTEKEFQFLDERVIRIDEQTYKKLQAGKSNLVRGNAQVLSEVVGNMGVQMVVLVQVQNAEQEVSVLPSNWVSIRSSVEASVVYTGDASVVATSRASAASSSLSKETATKEAIKKATKPLNNDLFNKLLKRWDAMINKGFEYTVTVGGLSYDEATAVKNALPTNIEGVKAVFERGFEQGSLALLVRFTGSAGELAKMLAIAAKTSVPLAVQSYNAKSIKLAKK